MTKQEAVIATIKQIEAEGTAVEDMTFSEVFARVTKNGISVHPNLVSSSLKFIQLYSHEEK